MTLLSLSQAFLFDDLPLVGLAASPGRGAGLGFPFGFKGGVGARLEALAVDSCAGLPLLPDPLVGPEVLGEVVVPHEDPVADGAGELLGARVGLEVSLELVGAGEALAAEEPVADEGPVAAVPAEVGLQVRGLDVGFATAGDVAVVEMLPLAVLVDTGPQPLCLHAVRATAGCLAGAAWHGPAVALGPVARVHGLLQLVEILPRDVQLLEPILGVEVLGGWGLVGRGSAELGLRSVGADGGLQPSSLGGGLEATLDVLEVHPACGPRMEVPPGGHVFGAPTGVGGSKPSLIGVGHGRELSEYFWYLNVGDLGSLLL